MALALRARLWLYKNRPRDSCRVAGTAPRGRRWPAGLAVDVDEEAELDRTQALLESWRTLSFQCGLVSAQS
jgi:hypothetical protein